jgi:chemotaxis protein CheX
MSDDAGLSEAIHLPKALDLRAAAPLLATLEGLRGKPVSIDASAVEQVGAQCIQILVSAQQTWMRDGALLTLVNPSVGLVEGLRLMGVPAAKIGE